MPHRLPETADTIVTRMLDDTGAAIMDGDFEAFAQHFCLPHTVDLFEGTMAMRTRMDLRALFDSVQTRISDLRVTDMIRHCEAAQFVSPESIITTHITHLMSGEVRVIEPYPCIGKLHLIDGRWQIGDSQYAMPDTISIERLYNAIKAQMTQDAQNAPQLNVVPRAGGCCE